MAQIDRITVDPSVMRGKPCIRGLRVSVATILGLLAAGRPRDEMLRAYPYLEAADFDQCLAYAAWKNAIYRWQRHEHQNSDRYESFARLGRRTV